MYTIEIGGTLTKGGNIFSFTHKKGCLLKRRSPQLIIIVCYFRRISFTTLVSALAEFSLTKCGGEAITWVMSTPGTCVVMTATALDAALLLLGRLLLE